MPSGLLMMSTFHYSGFQVKYYYIEDNAAALEPRCDSVVHLDVPQVKEATTDNKGLRIVSFH